MNISVRQVRNDITPQLRRLEDGLTGAGRRELLRTAGYEFWLITRESFGANKPNRPSYWQPLSPYTIKEYRERGISPLVPTLLRSGTLMNSITVGAPTDTYIEVYTTCDYATQHQFGNPILGVPARPYFPVINDKLTPYAAARITQALERKVQAMIRGGV